MKRRLVLATCLAGVIAGSAGAALAGPSVKSDGKNHAICVAITKNDNYHAADYFCITTPSNP